MGERVVRRGPLPSDQTLKGAGFRVRRPLPTARLGHVDLFLLRDHIKPVQLPMSGGAGAPDHCTAALRDRDLLLAGAMQWRAWRFRDVHRRAARTA